VPNSPFVILTDVLMEKTSSKMPKQSSAPIAHAASQILTRAVSMKASVPLTNAQMALH
jgi:hypothetical protein